MDGLQRLRFLKQYRSKAPFYDGIPAFRWDNLRKVCFALKDMYGLSEKQVFCFGTRTSAKVLRRVEDLARECRQGATFYERIAQGVPAKPASPAEARFADDFLYLLAIFMRENLESNLHFVMEGSTDANLLLKRYDMTRINAIRPYVLTNGASVFSIIPSDDWANWRKVCYGVKGLFGFIHMPIHVPLGNYPNRRLADITKISTNGRDISQRLGRIPFDAANPKASTYYQAFMDFSASFLELQFERCPHVVKKAAA